MKQLVLGFGQFVNEMFAQNESHEKKSACCGAAVLEDGCCSDCGAAEPKEVNENPEAAGAAHIHKSTGTEPKDV